MENRADPRRGLLVAAAVVAAVLLGLVGPLAGAGPASAQPLDGQLTGNVVVHGAPAGLQGEVGVVACPSTGPPQGLCQNPQYVISGSGGSYTLVLAPGAWQINTFYSVGYQGGAYLGRPRQVTIGAGATVRLNIGVHYQVPSTVSGTASVTGVPAQVTVEQLQVTACPLASPVSGGYPGPLCATDYLFGTDQYSIPTLTKGTWLLYVGYYTIFGSFISPTPTTVTLKKGASAVADLSTAYQAPTEALVEGTVTITGAPAGFTATSGVGGCPAVGGSVDLCTQPEYTLSGLGGAYQLVLPAGPWNLAGFYELAFFGGQFLSPVHSVDLAPGSTTQLDLSVPYAKPATVTSTITVTGVPPGQSVQQTSLDACPTAFPYTGTVLPIECVSAFSPSATVTIATLPAGTWLLYPGFVGSSGTQVMGTTPTTVTLKAGHTKQVALSLAY